MPPVAQGFQELASLRELLGARALSEIAADRDQIGLESVDLAQDSIDETIVMRTEVEIGQMSDGGHVRHSNAAAAWRFSLRPSEIQEQEQLDVHTEAFCAFLFKEVRNIGARDEMDIDVLILVAAALADPADAVGADQSEGFRQHPR